MKTQVDVGPHRDNAELETFSRLASESFNVPLDRMPAYFDAVGRHNVRVVRVAGEVVGGLVVIPGGQFFGGRPVRMAGVALVATAAHRRGTGAATALLRAVLDEQCRAGVPISALYPATVRLYRRAGYELAGVALEATVPTASIDVRERSLDVRPAAPADEAAIRALYHEVARHTPGALDRSDFHWQRVHNFRGELTRGYVFSRGDSLEGYVFIRDVSTGSAWSANLYVQDVACTTAAAARAVLTFLADHRSTRPQVIFRCGPGDPLLLQLGEIQYTLAARLPWMLRILDVPAALTGRGYPPGAEGELHLDVRDDFLPDTGGRFTLTVTRASASVTPGGRGDLAIDIRGLAALFSGHLGPHQLVLTGYASGNDTALETARGLFGGPAPWLRDEF